MNPLQFFAALRARKGIFALALLATVVTATAISFLLPKLYRATARVVVDTRQEQSLHNSVNLLFSPQERAAYIQTQVDIITSDHVAQEVVARLGLADDPERRREFAEIDGGAGSLEEWLANRLLRNLEVDTSQSAVIDISYTANDAAYAAEVVNTFTAAYIDRVLELRVEPTRHAAAWFDEQLKTLRAQLEQAQSELTDFQQEHGIVSADESVDVGYNQLAELASQVVRAREESIDLQSREALAERLRNLGISLERLPDVPAESVIRELRRDLQQGEARLRELATQYGANHPEYKRQAAENEARRQRLRVESDRLVALAVSRAEQGRERESGLKSAFDAQQRRLLAMKENRDKLTVLKRNVQTAQQAYDTVMQRYLTSQVESKASKTNVAMLSRAVPPRIPHRPKIPLNVLLSVIVGGMLGTGAVVFLELADRRVRTGSDLASGTDVPLLGELGRWRTREQLLLAGQAHSGRSLPAPD